MPTVQQINCITTEYVAHYTVLQMIVVTANEILTMIGPVSFEFFWNSSSQLHNQLLKLYLWPKFINPSKIARTSSHRSREAKITNFFSSKKAKSVSYIIIFCIFSMTGCPHKAKVLYEAKKKSKTFKSRLVIFWFLG